MNDRHLSACYHVAMEIKRIAESFVANPENQLKSIGTQRDEPLSFSFDLCFINEEIPEAALRFCNVIREKLFALPEEFLVNKKIIIKTNGKLFSLINLEE